MSEVDKARFLKMIEDTHWENISSALRIGAIDTATNLFRQAVSDAFNCGTVLSSEGPGDSNTVVVKQ
jgi:hypothetical protein